MVLITGAAGFVGANLVLRIIGESPQCHIIGLDNMNGNREGGRGEGLGPVDVHSG